MIYALKSNHPSYIKIQKLMEFLDKENISIRFDSYYGVFISSGDIEYKLQDCDGSRHIINELPPELEFHVTIERDEE